MVKRICYLCEDTVGGRENFMSRTTGIFFQTCYLFLNPLLNEDFSTIMMCYVPIIIRVSTAGNQLKGCNYVQNSYQQVGKKIKAILENNLFLEVRIHKRQTCRN